MNIVKKINDEKKLQQVLNEIERACNKFPSWPNDPLHAIAIVGEEYGEVLKETVQLTYEPFKSNHERVKQEAIQLAAMSIRFLLSVDRYIYSQSEEHLQGFNLKRP